MSEQPAQRPLSDDRGAWKAYWAAQGMTWRADSEISVERQAYLDDRRHNPLYQPDIERGIYPFKDIKLTRADVEWLLATHESGGTRGPVHWSNPDQHEREGLDLRGAILCGVNLANMPLACLRGGLTYSEWRGLIVSSAADASWAVHKKVPVYDTPSNILRHKQNLAAIHLEAVDLSFAHLEGTQLRAAHLEGAECYRAHFEMADLPAVCLHGTSLYRAHLEGANLHRAQMEGKHLSDDQLLLVRQWVETFPEDLFPADLRDCTFDVTTFLGNISLTRGANEAPLLRDVHWGAANLGVVPWGTINRLGDESKARRRKASDGNRKSTKKRIRQFERAVRAYRQLAIALRSQGLNEDADRFAYRALLLQRRAHYLNRQYFRYTISLLLGGIAGYGYRPLRSFITYVLMVGAFAAIYAALAYFGLTSEKFSAWDSPLVLSVTSFHGRVFFAGGLPLNDWAARVGAIEAVVGLLIEITFIATFTQRFFAR